MYFAVSNKLRRATRIFSKGGGLRPKVKNIFVQKHVSIRWRTELMVQLRHRRQGSGDKD